MAASAFAAFEPNQDYASVFNDSTYTFIGQEVQKMTHQSLGVPFLVPNERIKEVLDSVWYYFRPNTGDIATRYTINNETPYRYSNYGADMVKQATSIIYNDIVNYHEIQKNNSQFSAWNTLSGVNERGLRSFAPIKLNNKRAISSYEPY